MSHLIPLAGKKRHRATVFGDALDRAMVRRGVGQRGLSIAMRCSTTSIGNWRGGRTLPRIETARKLAIALDTPGLEQLCIELRTKDCLRCGDPFLDDSGSDNARYCSIGCRDWEGKLAVSRIGSRGRAGILQRRLTVIERKVAEHCLWCEPSMRCVRADCALRDVSPLPLMAPLHVDLAPRSSQAGQVRRRASGE